jgi:hypothetical protein
MAEVHLPCVRSARKVMDAKVVQTVSNVYTAKINSGDAIAEEQRPSLPSVLLKTQLCYHKETEEEVIGEMAGRPEAPSFTKLNQSNSIHCHWTFFSFRRCILPGTETGGPIQK